jgi:hypothetical protein
MFEGMEINRIRKINEITKFIKLLISENVRVIDASNGHELDVYTNNIDQINGFYYIDNEYRIICKVERLMNKDNGFHGISNFRFTGNEYGKFKGEKNDMQ